MKKSAVFGASIASLLLFAAPAGAGEDPPTMTATPNPAEVGDTVTVMNVDDFNSTCDDIDIILPDGAAQPAGILGSYVDIRIDDPDGDTVLSENLIPDEDGNWLISFEAEKVGIYEVFADCEGDEIAEAGVGPQALPEFSYEDLLIEVTGTTTTTGTPPSSAVGTSSTSTTGGTSPAAVTRPRFTG